MNILFGPAHDARHIDPDTPNGYEWWYFDTISDDGQYVLVVIFFLGTPMSPYYKSVVDGKNPLPSDWCGVFVSLHERKQGKPWRERAYAYNIYRGGDFDTTTPSAQVGGSQMRSEVVDGQWRWHLTLDEPGLWRGRTRAEVTFTLLGESLALPPIAESGPASNHHWACVAPRCRVEGVVTVASGEAFDFSGTGYHDHNFGMLPWQDAAFWLWARFHFPEGEQVRTAIFYHTVSPVRDQSDQSLILFLDQAGKIVARPEGKMEQTRGERNAYGFRHGVIWQWSVPQRKEGYVYVSGRSGAFSEGPFYRRLPGSLGTYETETRKDLLAPVEGIGEVFQPSRLCGPISSRAMWTRMRRRS